MYVKLFDSIIKSSIWDANPETRITWITCLLLCDQNGNFTATRRYIAREANLPLDAVDAALNTLLSDDPDTTTPDDDGRRMEYCGNNTWHIVNYSKYNEIAKAETVRAQTNERVKRHRERAKDDNAVTVTVTPGNADVTQSNETVTPLDVAIDAPVPVSVPSATNEQEASPVPAAAPSVDPVKTAKKAINRSITFDPATFTLSGITDDDRAQWAGYAPGCNINAEIAAFLDYMQTHPDALERTVKTGAWKAALNTRFRNVAKYGSTAGNGNPRASASTYRIPSPAPDAPRKAESPMMFTPSTAFDWSSVKALLRDRLDAGQYAKWIERIEYVGMSGDTVGLSVADVYTAKHIQANFTDGIKGAIWDVYHRTLPLHMMVRSEAAPKVAD